MAGKVMGIHTEEEYACVKLRMEGTQAEALVKWAGSHPGVHLEVHLCPPDCGKLAKEGLLHATKVRLLKAEFKEAWMDNLMDVAVARDEGKADELRRIRERAEKREAEKRRGAEGSGFPKCGEELLQFQKWSRSKEEEEEEEEQEGKEEGQEDLRDKGPVSSLLDYSSRSHTRCEEEGEEEGEEGCSEEDPSGSFERSELRGDVYRQPRDCGGPRAFVRRGGQGEGGPQAISGGPDAQHLGNDPRGLGVTDRAALGHRSFVAAPGVLPTLEAESERPHVRADEPGSANTLLPTRPSTTGQGGDLLRHDYTEAQEPRAGGAGQPLHRGPATGAGPLGCGRDVDSHGDIGGIQTPEGGGKGQVSFSQALGQDAGMGK